MRVTIVAIGLVGVLTSFPVVVVRAASNATDRLAAGAPRPPTPVAQSLTDRFRDLLAMSKTEREAALASRPAEKQRTILSCLDQFDRLDPNEREVRLQRMKLREQLVPLLRAPAAQRDLGLAAVPVEDRPLLQERLEKWDQLPPALQKAVLENESMLNCVMPGQTVSSNQLTHILATLSRELKGKLAPDLQRWNDMPAQKREEMYKEFQIVFDLNPQERAKVCSVLSVTERQQMERTLQAFRTLPKAQRDQCVASFEKFSGMSPAERLQFLKNVEQWQQMSLSDRETWKKLVNRFPPFPPSPRGVMPPMPPAPATRASAVVQKR